MTETPERRPEDPADVPVPVSDPPAAPPSPEGPGPLPVVPPPPVQPPAPVEPAAEPPAPVEPVAEPPAPVEPVAEPPTPAPPASRPAAVRVTPRAPLAATAVDPAGVEAATTATAPAAATSETEPQAGSRRRLLVPLGLGLLVLLLLVAGGFLFREVREGDQVESARREALAAARSHAVKLLSYDYRTLEEDFAAATAVTTGRFKGQYEETTTEAVGPSATEYKVVVEADVRTLGVADASPDRVVVIAFINQTTTSTRVDGPKLDQNRVRLTLVDVDGRWLVSDVDAL